MPLIGNWNVRCRADTELVHWEWNADKVPTGFTASDSTKAENKKKWDSIGGNDSMQFDKSNIIMFGPTGSGVSVDASTPNTTMTLPIHFCQW